MTTTSKITDQYFLCMYVLKVGTIVNIIKNIKKGQHI